VSTSQSEDWEQAQFVSWWRKTQPDEIFAIPNGGKRNKVTAAKMKLTGTTPGVWDLFVPARFLWIEFKRSDRGTLSTEQKSFGAARLSEGYTCMVAWGCADAVLQIENGARSDWKRPKKPKH
jgi:hypothetical protein